ncbi:hypothetical protein [Leptolyngbya sp. PCC 6406]|uniref:hypothetical protein n=1 Tax=Leptolyngbya sp. PCC 6406 TaxID=1173264 RepID=UPI0002AC91BB|nr:hypothetical protein [Leptolyngbya sp. PCC 6406]
MERIPVTVLDRSQSNSFRSSSRAELTLQQAQQQIFDFLLDIVRYQPWDVVVEEFKRLFFNQGDTTSSEAEAGLYAILFTNSEPDFHNTLKRACYILVNNWELARKYEAIQAVVALFQDTSLTRQTFSPTLKRLREWLQHFVKSSDYRDLQLFAARFSEEAKTTPWTSRYTPYLLVDQYMNTDNPQEQREAARTLSRRLKDKYKFDLAMYTAHSQSALAKQRVLQNPTALGDSALRLIKTIVAKRGRFSYRNLAHLFLTQTEELSYRRFKRSLIEYLIYSAHEPQLVKTLKRHLHLRLDPLYQEYDDDIVDSSLILRTCNRVIDYLMTEDKKSPSELFTLLLSQSSSLSLAIVLLKIILISRNSHPYLEGRIASLIWYYDQFPPDQCAWVINFLEVFQVTFAIYAENVEYNLINPQDPNGKVEWSAEALEACRVFSQLTASQWGHQVKVASPLLEADGG